MLISICVTSLVLFIIARIICEYDFGWNYTSLTVAIIAILMGLVYCKELIKTARNIYIFIYIMLFVSICLYIIFKQKGEVCKQARIASIFTLLCVVSIYIITVERVEKPDVDITTCDVICIKEDNIKLKLSGYVYIYYYETEDGGFCLGDIPVNSTTIYYVEEGEEPYIETVISTSCLKNSNFDILDGMWEIKTTTYNYYVPKDFML